MNSQTNITSNQPALRAMLQSHAQWWADAGVGISIEDNPIKWLEANDSEAAFISARDEALLPSDAPKPPRISTSDARRAEQLAINSDCPEFQPTAFPAEFLELQQALAARNDYPGGHYGGARLPLQGDEQAIVAVFTDLPSEEDLIAGKLFGASEGKLLANMLRAIGLSMAQCIIIPLAATRPASGAIPTSDFTNLSQFALWQMQKTRASSAILLGDAVSRAFLGDGLMQKCGTIQTINHNMGSIAAVNCFHPRTLIARPAFKREAWAYLQLLAVKDRQIT